MRGCTILLFVISCFINEVAGQLTYNEVKVDYDSAWSYKNLTLIPIRFKATEPEEEKSAKKRPITFSEAMSAHKIKVQEMQYELGADVNWLQVTNTSKQTIVIQAGEIVAGGKQDRMMAETKFIRPGSTDYLHVFCVEKRRWDEKPKTFSYQGIANSQVRKAMDITNRQAEIWQEIDKEFETQKKKSETWSYLELYKDGYIADSAYYKYFMQRYAECDRNLAGFVFLSGNEIMSAELFSSPELLDISYRNMLLSYIQTAAMKTVSTKSNPHQVKSFLDKILMNEEGQRGYVNAHGKMHKEGNKIIHLIAYPAGN